MMREYYRRRKTDSCILRREFLRNCIAEQVLPKCAPRQLIRKNIPFSKCAFAYLKDACEELSCKIEELRTDDPGTRLSARLTSKLQNERRTQEEKLGRKLKAICDSSEWNKIGRTELIRNLSSRQFSDIEIQALSLGLKFDSGVQKEMYADLILKNYRWSEKDIEKGFKQGVISCFQALKKEEPPGLPRRFKEALTKLSDQKDIIITQADKGGGIVILDKMDYINKMNDLLNDTETYRETRNGFTLEKATEFTKEARTILSKTDKGKLLIGLLEEAPTPPRMKGLPKIHKPNIPMRPITSGIGSAPHRLARQLAKPLSQTLGSISTAHLKNSTDLIERLKSINFQKKKLASFDVKALFTNVPSEEALQATRRAIENISEEELPLNKDDYIKLISLCIGYNCFTFEGKEYVQHRGLAMGFPISAVIASLFMENLEEDKLIPIMGRGSNWFRYVDDIIVVVPEKKKTLKTRDGD